jgi:DNA-binding transcriptional LysR family regulator
VSLDQRQLLAFVAVVDSGSVGRAAERVNISQPALSRLVRAMEHRLGVRLFDRVTTGMALTEAGEAFLPHARLLVAELSEATDLIDEIKGLKRGQVRLGAVSSVTSTFLPDAIHRFQSCEPGLLVRIHEADTDTLLSQLLKREVDLVIAAELRVAGIEAIARLEFADHFTVVCSHQHPLAGAPAPRVENVLDARWVLQSSDRTPRRLFDALFEKLGVRPPIAAVETDSASTAIALLRNSDCLGWMAARVGHEAGLAELQIEDLMVERRYLIFRRQNGLLPAPARRLLDYLPLLDSTLGPSGR